MAALQSEATQQLALQGFSGEPPVEMVCVSFDICQTVIPFREFLNKTALTDAGYFRCPFCGGTSWKVREKRRRN